MLKSGLAGLALAIALATSAMSQAYNPAITSCSNLASATQLGCVKIDGSTLTYNGQNQLTAAASLNVAQRAPVSTDDSAHGFLLGQNWIFGDKAYTAIDVTQGAAAWQLNGNGFPLPADSVTDVAPFAVYGTHLLKSAYAGYALRVQRASDNTTLDVGFLNNGTLNNPALTTFLVGTTGRVITWYDQSGAAHNATATAVTSAPAITANNTIGNATSITFDLQSYISANGLASEALNIPSGFSGSNSNVAVFTVARQSLYYNAGGYGTNTVQLAGPSGNLIGLYFAGNSSAIYTPAGATATVGAVPLTTPQIVGFNMSGSTAFSFNGKQLRADTNYNTPAALSAGGTIGVGQTLLSNNGGDPFEVAAVLIYPGMSLSDQSTLQASLARAFNIIPQTVDVLAVVGDSITAGTQGTYNSGYTRKLDGLLTKPVNLYNFGNYGQPISTFVGLYSDFSQVYNAGAKNNIMTIFGGTNDIQNGVSGAATYASLVNLCTEARATGYKIVVATMLPRASLSTGAQAQWNVYNALIRANWTTIADGLADVAASDVMGPFSASSNSSLYADGTHPTDLGYTYLAPIFATAVNALLR